MEPKTEPKKKRSSSTSSHLANTVEMLRSQVDTLKITATSQEERIKHMSEDMESVNKRLAEMEQKIIENQNRSYQRLIATQGAVLLLVLSTVIGLIVQSFFQ